MSLITCPDCQNPVSDLAETCIHCGRPMGRPPPVPSSQHAAPPRTRWQLERLARLAVAMVATVGAAWWVVTMLDTAGPGGASPEQIDAEVSVQCRPIPTFVADPPTVMPVGQVTCSVQHTSGTDAAKACWNMKITCGNGKVVTGHACATVHSKETQTVALSDLRGAPACDAVASAKLENLTVGRP